ncbi:MULTISPECIES: ferredoxin III, nif-specific [Pseudomonadota]|jgi:Nif-specific ferredoxin III|uniref:Ferredoxin III n=1 Tax=Stutzerimonas stutzeri NF13 TaxID=1212548 RepID=M2VPW6_STUST|nr:MULTISPECIES: ferredoxin III, nif-specific [Pseudomonadota]WOF80119.1 ferredoxin III, nif-specific [Pseudomonas sp. FeN3W]EME02023.1 ferredoxin, 4Fe-4S [Stutzerimonas stutzeri NF13]MBC2732627.1 ferredoxin III, nif-specific [Thiobacillus sp.]MBC2741364.1 ferredoxin III, nif-specific [Thiobacillus sp.]MBK3880467.1 ferredoxin III, nif-specific [Stutzerimonas stutzeri]|tara:strand:+ start:399 stop:695 length:297 start_codon:yes stop_codon:yes gene_type:complete
MEAVITGRTRGGSEWVPQFVTAVDAQKCIGCGRCYKVCPRDVFELVERSGMVDEDDDLYDEDDEMMVMAIADGLDCIGCKACAAVCPKQCHTHQALAG